MINIAIIINPVSGKGSGSKFQTNLQNLSLPSNINLTTYTTKARSHATEIAKSITQNFDRILIAGGDGTFNEFVNGFNVEGNSNTLIGFIPIGSGNDFALSLYKSQNNFKTNIEYFFTERVETKKVDLGNVVLVESDGKKFLRKFINSLGIGFDARVAFLNQTDKIFRGSMSYIFAILRAFVIMNPINYRINLDGKIIETTALFCSIGNGESVGGGLYLMPGARLNDSNLDLSVVRLDSRLKLLKLLPKAMNNTLPGCKELEQWKFRVLEIELGTPYYTHIDGEVMSSKSKYISIKVDENKLNVII